MSKEEQNGNVAKPMLGEVYHKVISRFDSWLFEDNQPSRPPLHKVGDKVLLKYKEYSVEVFGKFVHAYARHGGLAEITKIEAKNGSWIYFLKLITGSLSSYSGRRSTSSYYYAGDNKTIRSKQSDLVTEGLEKFLKIWKTAAFSVGQEVSYQNVTRTVKGVATEPTIKEGKVFYFLAGVSDPVEESLLESDVTITPGQEEILIDEIAKKLKVEIRTIKTNHFEFNVETLDLNAASSGLIFFRTDRELSNFVDEMNKFIDSKVDKDLQACLNDGKSSVPKVKPSTTWRGGKIDKKNIREAARNLGIDMKSLFQKMRGTISGKKFGV